MKDGQFNFFKFSKRCINLNRLFSRVMLFRLKTALVQEKNLISVNELSFVVHRDIRDFSQVYGGAPFEQQQQQATFFQRCDWMVSDCINLLLKKCITQKTTVLLMWPFWDWNRPVRLLGAPLYLRRNVALILRIWQIKKNKIVHRIP